MLHEMPGRHAPRAYRGCDSVTKSLHLVSGGSAGFSQPA